MYKVMIRFVLRPICWRWGHRSYSWQVNQEFWEKNRSLLGPDAVGGVLVQRDYCLRCGKPLAGP